MLNFILKSIYGKSTALLLACSLLFMSFTTAGASNVVTLKSGTVVTAELISYINSSDVKRGEMVEFRVINNVKAEGVVVIPAGSIAKGQIVKVEKNGILGQAGELTVAIKSVQAIDGTNVLLTSPELSEEGKDRLVASIAFTLLCVFGFIIKGGEAEIGTGAQINATVISDTEIAVN